MFMLMLLETEETGMLCSAYALVTRSYYKMSMNLKLIKTADSTSNLLYRLLYNKKVLQVLF